MTPPDPRLLGPLIAQLRLARGWSQQRLAAELCAASGAATVTRHEISRWERQARVPGDRWLRRLALVLDAPAGLLVEAAGRSRHHGPVGAGGSRSRSALLALAQRWVADPQAPLLVAPAAHRSAPVGAPGRSDPGGPAGPGELAELRRLDDLTGGADLAPAGAYRLRRAVRALAGAGPAERRRLLPVLAETAQLAGWLHADAGEPTAGLDAYRLGLRAAAAAGDPALAGHVLGSASHLLAGAGDPEGALLLARTAYAGARRSAGPGLRALLLHRVALAAALGGRARAARQALDAARQTAGAVEPGAEPAWLYWLDDTELAAMTGRALVALGRPRPALPLLRAARRGGRPRRAAVYGGWLARGLLQLGEVEQACAVAGAALLDAVRAGSARAATPLVELERRLAAHRTEPAVRRYAALLADARGFLPRGPVTAPSRPPAPGRRGGMSGAAGATRRPGGGTRPTPTG
ncbi:helix-turn-helix domain-containing protein [Micromonospora purpureochromogenes]|uniref:Transcriptional regulator with XRE-family HTH domain n=1 Tax=Micromonospora purpureochromogenes TaxID=47872 RepID=A0ABX2RGH2_9ACTN|nr:helix-turn-helix transcriptional regulator [Micromonospora purpureochromogenes]NYF54296.1 transcriptional regulator with XRE-family HTH domain [Micromonospora purpureochromogenes]